MYIGTAGWSIPRDVADALPGAGTHLERYARGLACVEINSSFYRPHRVETYQRWAATTPPDFRFSVKLPRAITHDARLRNVREPLERFLGDASGLGPKLAVVLVQLPPSLAFDARTAGGFFRRLRASFEGAVVCEPRHASWFTPSADQRLCDWHICRAAADPAPHPAASAPGGWPGNGVGATDAVRYYRWHGSPRMYWSRYDAAWLRERADAIASETGRSDAWCIFDNTAAGAATVNALELGALVEHDAEPSDDAAPTAPRHGR
jgi:uncharacterized protein YecE (DUF72 family)